MTWGVDCYAVDWADGDGIGGGLWIKCSQDVSCWRHNHSSRRTLGLWVVYVHITDAARTVLGIGRGSTDVAVVDDFGNLVLVGELL